MKANRVNIHFESEITDKKINSKINFDYIYFLINKSNVPLFTQESFEVEYLEFIDQFEFKTDHLRESNDICNWWVEDIDCDITKKLNSKVYIHDHLNNWKICSPNGIVIKNEESFNQFKNSGDLIRLEYAVSGRGTLPKERYHSKIRYPFILAKKRERILDFGLIGNEEGSHHYLSLVDKSYCFRGFLVPNANQNLTRGLNVHIDESKKLFKKLFLSLESEFGVKKIEQIQLDSFIYKDGNQSKLEFCHEVNFRKSMSLLIPALSGKSLFKKDWSCVIMLQLSERIPFSILLKELSEMISAGDIIPLSPIQPGPSLFIINFEGYSNFVELLDSLSEVLGNRNNSVYNELKELIGRLLEAHEYR